MGKHRSRLKILANILDVVNENNGAKKTQIMYKAYLSYQLLIRYLREVTEAGLVTCENENCYNITPKGQEFLSKFFKYNNSRKTVNKQLSNVENQKSLLEELSSPNQQTMKS